jgi:hypothetical protein
MADDGTQAPAETSTSTVLGTMSGGFCVTLPPGKVVLNLSFKLELTKNENGAVVVSTGTQTAPKLP